MSATRKSRTALILILLIGAALRLAGIGNAPPGLYNDEAQHGLDALDVLDGKLQLYFPANNGREPMFIYWVAATQAILGSSPLTIRLPSFFAGVLTLAATYAMARAFWNRKAGLYATAILAGTFWHVHLSRMGYRAVLLPLFTALMLTFVARALRSTRTHTAAGADRSSTFPPPRRRHWLSAEHMGWSLAGLMYGLSWYTYIAARFTPVALLALVLAAWAWQRDQVRQHWKGFALFCLTALVVLLPLGIFTLLHPDIVLARSGQVSIFSPDISGGQPLRMLISQIGRALGMFFIQGDRIWRHNLAWRPIWGPALGLMFVIGCGALLANARRDFASSAVLLWVGVMLIPTILAEDCPHFLRGVGILPVAALIPAAGLLTLERWLGNIPGRRHRRALLLLPWLCIGLDTGATVMDYQHYVRADFTYYWLEGGVVDLAGEINSIQGEGWDGDHYLHGVDAPGQVYIEAALWDKWKALRYLNGDRITVGLPDIPLRADQHTAIVVWPYQDWDSLVLPLLPHPAYIDIRRGPYIQGDLDPEALSLATLVEIRPVPEVPDPIASFANGMALHAALVRNPDSTPEVMLWWQASKPLESSCVIFVHAIRNETRIGQHDGAPALGHLNTVSWQPGDLILDRHPLQDGNSLTGVDTLRIGMYDAASGEGVSMVDAQGNELAPWFSYPVIEAPE